MSQPLFTNFQSPPVAGFFALPGADLSVGGSLARSQQATEMGKAFGNLFGALSSMFNRLQICVDEARNKGDLVTLSDRSLTDLGIRRDDIPAIIASGGLDQGVRSAVKRFLTAGSRTA